MSEIAKKTQAQQLAAPAASVDYKTIVNDFLHGTGSRLTEGQKDLFVKICETFNLNPFKREAYAVPYKDSQKVDRLTIIVGYEVYLKRAEASGKLDGWETAVQGTDENMTAEVTIWRKDWSRPMRHKIFAKEFAKNGGMWAAMPRYMLEKVAISQAFRRAFPEDLGGMPYTKEEMDSRDVINVNGTELPNEPINMDNIVDFFSATNEQELQQKWAKLSDNEKMHIKSDEKLKAEVQKMRKTFAGLATGQVAPEQTIQEATNAK